MHNARVLGLVAFLGLVGPVPAVADQHELGEALYNRYCAACHGATGGGEGDMQNFLNIHMPNLRTMAQRNDGVFPLLQTIHIIDGRSGVRAHGGPMPLWGNVFAGETEPVIGYYGSVLETRGRVLSLALYLESLQD